MDAFIYNALPSRVIFGRDTVQQLSAEIEALGGKRALVLTTPFQKDLGEEIAALLGDVAVGVYDNATMHTPVEVTEAAMAVQQELAADILVTVGGGSTIGLAKAIALRTDLPQIAIPTTYAGSEMTPIIGQTEKGVKTTQKTLKVLPETVIYDVNLTLTLPAKMSGSSGLNAIAHAVEALYAKDRNPIVSMMAEEGTRALAGALPVLMDDESNVEARSDALYGAWLCGAVLGMVGMSLHHKLCHTLGGSFDLPHAETHSIVLPHALAYNAPATPDAVAALSRALSHDNPAQALFEISRQVDVPVGLKALGMPEDGIDKATEIAMSNPYWNPRPLERDLIRDVISNAWAGDAPVLL
ncbi:MAG: maleylacetate reductase [Kordiimonas sp.]|nr:maleylacetate reductase [Kordiimonas sp.]|tara:strand:- start:158 stop:1222 length:1065 start_codon:yes stop_codon:yes gene_type:complete